MLVRKFCIVCKKHKDEDECDECGAKTYYKL